MLSWQMIIYIWKEADSVYSREASYEIFTGNMQKFMRDINLIPQNMFVSNTVYLQLLLISTVMHFLWYIFIWNTYQTDIVEMRGYCIIRYNSEFILDRIWIILCNISTQRANRFSHG